MKKLAGSLNGFVAKLTAMRGPGDSLEVYEDWALSYEEDMLSSYAHVAPRIAVDAYLATGPDLDAPLVDFGCGTGLVGIELAGRGCRLVDGIDVSPSMLREAGAKGVYRNLLCGDLTTRTVIEDGAYAGAIAVGCFGSGHLGPEHLGEIIRAVQPGGVIVLYTNGVPYEEDDYPAHLERLESYGWWQVMLTERSNYTSGRERPGWVVVARRGSTAVTS